ncbi:hypothetical protein BG015_010451 [Linnemannia schmuckeri]|uniref:FAD-binding domain-containing protein n=1 Tax=Linnemannia schmuckeri TaxID=64567 RepID=A0A9P5RUH5_9FUNG|nr:hypothetical protein BG015_010451 [Linnemannia schmuckeri]
MSFSKDLRGKDAKASSRPKRNNNKPYSSSSPSGSRTRVSSSTSTRTPYPPRRQPQTQAQRILIIGGSIHGLILAILFQRLRIDYLILERSCEFGVPLNGIVLGSFAVNLLEMLGLVDVVKSRSTEMHRMKIWRESGIIQAETDFSGAADRYSHNGIAIAGRVLLDILRDQIPGDKILTGKEVKGYVQDEFEVRASCQDGGVYWGTMLVGCDGMNSTIRKLLHQEQAARLSAEDRRPDRRTCSVMGVTRVLDDVTYLDPDTMQDIFRMDYINTQVILGQAEPFACWMVPMPVERRISWMITYHRPDEEPAVHPDELEPDSMDRPNVEQEFVNKVRDYYCPYGGGSLGQLLDHSDPEDINQVSSDRRSYDMWYSGRVVLGGDACHKLVPGGGQGALQAMLDACSLAPLIQHALITSGDTSGAEQLRHITIALESYYRERHEIARTAVEGSADLSRLMALHFAHEPASLTYLQDPNQPLMISPSGQPILFMAPPNIDLEFDFFPAWLQRYAEGMDQFAAEGHGAGGEEHSDDEEPFLH